MKLLTSILILGLVFGVTSEIHAQDTNKEVRQIQPRIIVILYTKKDQDLRTVLESDISLRVAVSKVKEGFDKRGFSTIDFVGVTKAAELDGVLRLFSLGCNRCIHAKPCFQGTMLVH